MKTTLIASTLLACAVAVGSLGAQPQRLRPNPYPLPTPAVPCPQPFSTVIQGSNPPAVDASDVTPGVATAAAGSQWNHTAINKAFGHTFHFPAPGTRCCLMTSGILTVEVKALQGGGPHTATSANDGFSIISNGVTVTSQQPWVNSGVTTGTVAVLTFTIPPNVLATGLFTFYAQDDSAILSAKLSLKGCCL